ncbi:MAG: DUF1016 N-terminal domain-containing protein [Candidatus Omnitrophota bacterium]
MSKTPATNRFNKLVEDISTRYTEARQAQVLFAWETGKRIVQEEQNGEMRAKYGTSLLRELAKVLTKKHGVGFSERNLQRMRNFYMEKPISPPAAKLGWSHYVELMPVRDEKVRKRLEQRIVKEGLNKLDVRVEVRRLRLKQQAIDAGLSGSPTAASGKILPPLKRPANLKLNTFSLSPLKVKRKDNHELVDCGFFVSWPVVKSELKNLDLAEMSYTYAATIDRVVDGDTLLVLIEAGFGIIVRDRLRLNGINCPELGTPEGGRAKKFVEKILPPGAVIVLKSHKCKTDAYGRFVADILYLKGSEDPAAIIREGAYLNQELVDRGLAERVEY